MACAENSAAAYGHVHRTKLSQHAMFASFADPKHEMHAMGDAEAQTKLPYQIPWQTQMLQPGAVHVAVPEYRSGVDYVGRRIRSRVVSLTQRWEREDLIGTEEMPRANDQHELVLKASEIMPFVCADAKHQHQHYIMAIVLKSANASYFPAAAEVEINVKSFASPPGIVAQVQESKSWIRERVADVRNRKGAAPLRFLGFVLRSHTRIDRPDYWFTAPTNTATRYFHMIEALRDGLSGLGRDMGNNQVLLPAALTSAGVPTNIATAMVLREWKSYITQGKPFASLSANQLPVESSDGQAGLILGRDELKAISTRYANMLHEGSGLWQSDLTVQFTLLDFAEHWQPILRRRPHGTPAITVHLELELFTVVLGGA